jgi:Flp pilus assembly pilin Flp
MQLGPRHKCGCCVANQLFGINCNGGDTKVKRIDGFLRDESGAELAEYAVGVAIVVAIAILVYQVLGDAINAKMISVAGEIDAPPPPAP